ncbi:MAG: cyclic nucleotide-binding domain-containing protein [Acidobacteriota bacterium]
MSVKTLLVGHELFKSLPVHEVERISGFASARSMDKGETIYRHDGKASHAFVLLEGRVRLLLPAHTGETNLSVGRVEKGELFGIAPLLGMDRYTTTAVCDAASSILALEAGPLLKVLREYPAVEARVMQTVARAYLSRYEILLARLQVILNQAAGG